MKHLKKIMVCITMLFIEQIVFGKLDTQQHNYNPDDTSKNAMQSVNSFSKNSQMSAADEFVAQSYISPAMQAPIFALYEKPFIIDKKTGAPVLLDENNNPRSWPTIDEIIEKIGDNLDQRNAAIAVKDAIDIAIENARLTFALQADEKSVLAMKNQETQVMQDLAAKKEVIKNIVQQQLTDNDNPKLSDEEIAIIEDKITPSNSDADIRILSQTNIAERINTHDFEILVNQGDNDKAAQLLVRECYIAQNKVNLLDNARMHTLLNQAKKLYNKDQIHKNLTKIARAVKTALFIAQNKYGTSWYNPNRYLYATHPLIKELQKMDELVRQDLIQPIYGATAADINREYYYKLATNIAIGVIGAAVVIGSIAVAKNTYDNYDIRKTQMQDSLDYGYTTLANAPQAIFNATNTAAQKIYDTTLKPLEKLIPQTQSTKEFYEKRVETKKKEAEQAKNKAKLTPVTDPKKAEIEEEKARIKAKELKLAQAQLEKAEIEERLKKEKAKLSEKEKKYEGGIIDDLTLVAQKKFVQGAENLQVKAEKELKQAEKELKQAEKELKQLVATKTPIASAKPAENTTKPTENKGWSFFGTSKPAVPAKAVENKNGILESIKAAGSKSVQMYNDQFETENSLIAQEASIEAARNKIEEGKKIRAQQIAEREEKARIEMQQDPEVRKIMDELRKEGVIA